MRTSRNVPPPTAVMDAIIIIPIMSIPFFPPFSAPENAKTAVPNTSRACKSEFTVAIVVLVHVGVAVAIVSPPLNCCRMLVVE